MAIFKKKTKDEKAQLEAVQEEKKTAVKAAAKKAPAKKAAAKKTSKKKDVSLEARAKAHEIILGPVVTEKTAMLSDRNILVLRVAPDANRVAIRNAIKALYGVTPTKVNVMNVSGKRVRFGRTMGQRKNWKKAVITLPEGSRIDIFEGV